MMQKHSIERALFRKYCGLTMPATALFASVSLAASGGALAAGPCSGPGAPTTTQTQCETAVRIPGNPLQSFDISWVNPDRAEYYLGDRANAGVSIINTDTLKFKRTFRALRVSCSTLPIPL